MRQSKKEKACEHPEKLKGKPGECTPEQIRECHGDDKKHCCVTKR
jgi:hypothetical protein